MFSSPWWLPGGHLQTIYASLRPPPRVALERSAGTRPTATSSTSISPATRRRRGAWCCSTASRAAPTATTRAPSPRRRSRQGWRWRCRTFAAARASRTACRAPTTPATARRSTGFCATSMPAAWPRLASRSGGNALLKWLGERGDEAQALVQRAAAVSAPIDLAAAGHALDRGLNRLLYTRHFLSTLKPKSLAKLERFPGLYDAGAGARARCFREFDDTVTAPLHGFRDVDHYWSARRAARGSSASACRRWWSTRATTRSCRSMRWSPPREKPRPAWC